MFWGTLHVYLVIAFTLADLFIVLHWGISTPTAMSFQDESACTTSDGAVANPQPTGKRGRAHRGPPSSGRSGVVGPHRPRVDIRAMAELQEA